MPQIQVAPERIPRLPVLGWDTFASSRGAPASALLDAPHVRYTTSGRAAIALALRMLGVGPGDRVLAPTYHCPTMIAPATHAGAQPVFYPIRPNGAPALEFLERLDLVQIKVLVAAHYFGVPQPLARLRAFCDRHNIALIEDCAHALFGESDGRLVGSWGDVAVASLTKFFPVPEGGALTSTRRPLDGVVLAGRGLAGELQAAVDVLELSARFRRFAGLNPLLAAGIGLKRLLRGAGQEGPRTIELDDASTIDIEEAEASFDAVSASSSPVRLARWLVQHASRARLAARRRRNYAALAERLAGLDGAAVLWPRLPETAVPYVLPLWVDDPDRRYYALKAAGLPVFRWDQLWPGTPHDPRDVGRLWSRHIFQLPCHQDLSDGDIDWMVGTLQKVFSGTPVRPGRSVPPAVVVERAR